MVTSDKKIDINKNRKLLKTIVVKGDSNITSATIDDEGSLLVVSTAIDVKAFRLEHQDPVNASDVKISSAELPQKLAGVGAIKVQLSPNAQWLCAVQEGSRVVMAALDPVSPRTSLVFSPRVQRLTRLRRQIPRHILNGGMGSYDRTITQVAFSPDSKMLAVSDIAGYIDTWILSDGEKTKSDDASSASESDSSDEEEESSQGIEKWIRNPGAKLMPKLQNAATVLSFSADIPQAKVSPRSSFDGINGPSNPVDDYTLLAITSGWNLLLFHPLQGCLTPWSRKHTRKDLPAPVQDLLDLPKGVFWQGSRAWIYGVSFLLMLDLAQDLPKPQESEDTTATTGKNLKRKRTGPSTGAGGRMEQGAIAPSLIRKHTAGQ